MYLPYLLAAVATICVLISGQFSEHKTLFFVLLAFVAIARLISSGLKMSSSRGADGSIDYGKTAPAFEGLGLLFFVVMTAIIVLFVWLCIVVWI
jgi:hypothetical protein